MQPLNFQNFLYFEKRYCDYSQNIAFVQCAQNNLSTIEGDYKIFMNYSYYLHYLIYKFHRLPIYRFPILVFY